LSKKKKIIVIGSGFSGLSAATSLAQKGYEVCILEKNSTVGGRARSFSSKGFTFDMGPSWYWMPDVFENYFQKFGKKVSDYYELKRLDPSYRVCFAKDDIIDLPARMSQLIDLFESIEKGSGEKLKQFLKESKYKYEVGMNDLVFKPGLSLTEFIDKRVITGALQLHLLKSMRKYIRSFFKNPKLRKLMEFPVLFLGGTPENTPALYSLMNYADISLGTWYPMGGMHKIIEGMVKLAKEMGVQIICDAEVKKINVKNGRTFSASTKDKEYFFDAIVAGADYHHVEQKLIDPEFRRYDKNYWDKRDMAPSSLLFYLGINKKIEGIKHHSLFFDEDFDGHAHDLYTKPKWPEKPLFYVCAPSVTDPSVAPEGMENLFLLMPTAPGLEDNDEQRERYYHLLLDRLEKFTGQKIKEHVVYKRSYALTDFVEDYNAFKGNAYGLANTLKQTAILKPSMKSKKLPNLYFTGQLTVPGPGVPPSLISGQIVADLVQKEIKLAKPNLYENTI
tara:strand:- start:381 stop:1892 length:1512 start_codon:yes stop_codon:yes gene_type:complete